MDESKLIRLRKSREGERKKGGLIEEYGGRELINCGFSAAKLNGRDIVRMLAVILNSEVS